MLDIKTLTEFKNSLNMKLLADTSGVCYSTFTKKIYRFLKNSENGELTVKESRKLQEGLEKLRIRLIY